MKSTNRGTVERKWQRELDKLKDSAAEYAKRIPDERGCRCSLRVALVGDGCSACQPDTWKDILESPE